MFDCDDRVIIQEVNDDLMTLFGFTRAANDFVVMVNDFALKPFEIVYLACDQWDWYYPICFHADKDIKKQHKYSVATYEHIHTLKTLLIALKTLLLRGCLTLNMLLFN